MKDVLGDCLFPVMLGSNTRAHACVRKMGKLYGTASTVLTGKRALALRVLPDVRVVYAPPAIADDLMLDILRDLSLACGMRVPLLILCDEAYGAFLERNRAEVEAHFILRRADEVLGKGEI